MKELIKIEETVISNETTMGNVNTALVPVFKADLGQGEVNAVNARELHEYLGVKSRFNDWINRKIQDCYLEAGSDFHSFVSNNGRGRPTTEYYLSIDSAKELAMAEHNEKGRLVRKYFIECEKQLLKKSSLKEDLLYSIIRASTDVEKAIALNDYERGYVIPLENKVQEQAVVIEEQTQVIEKAKPKVEFYDTVTSSNSTADLAEVAKTLNFKGVGRNTLYKLLREWGILTSANQPYQKYVNAGYFKLVEYVVPGPYGRPQVKYKTVCYQKGLDCIQRLLKKRGFVQTV